MLEHVAFTHPNAVRFYKKQGDEEFKSRFLTDGDEGVQELSNPFIRDVIKSDQNIHVRYTFDYYFEDGSGYGNYEEKEVVALSQDAGVSWYFLHGEEYQNESIIEDEDRLL